MTAELLLSVRDRGAASLELVGLLPLLLVFGSYAFQAGVAMWTASSTAEAARTAARAASLGDDPTSAAAASLPGALEVDRLESFAGPAHGVRLYVDVPRVSLIPQFEVVRSAVLP